MTARLLYADSESSADMFYGAGMFVPDPFLFLQTPDGRRHIVLSVLEVDRGRKTAAVDEVHSMEELTKSWREQEGNAQKTPNMSQLAAFFLQGFGVKAVSVNGDFPLGMADKLREQGVTVTAAEGAFWAERECKRPEEVAAVEEALRITGLGMAAGIETIRKSSIGADGLLHLDGEVLTSERVRAAINTELVVNGAMPHHTIVSGGDQGADPHEEGSGPLEAHRSIILDVFPRVEKSGYFGDMTRTVCRGEASDQLKNAWEAVRQGQEAAFSRIRAGASGKAVHEAVAAVLAEAGFPTGPTKEGRQGGFFHGTGHGLGLDVHEAPRISTRDQELKAGHVVTVEPGLYYPDMGGVRLEDVVVVEEGGCRNLTTFPKFFEV